MPKSVSFTDPYAQDYAELARQQKMAELLSQQAAEPIGNTQMVSGWAVPQGALPGLNKVAQSLAGAFAQYKTGEREKMLAEKIREGGKKDAADFVSALQGTPAKSEAFQADTFDETDQPFGKMTTETPAVAGDRQKALAVALGSGNPMVQSAGSSLLANMLKAPEWKVTERYNDATGRAEKVLYDTSNPENTKPFGGQKASEIKFVNGQAYDPLAVTPGTVIPKQADAPNLASDLLIPGEGGRLVPNSALIAAKKDISRAGASNTSIKIDNKTGESLAKEVGPIVAGSRDKAQAAVQQIETLDRFDAALAGNKLYAGPAAGIRLKGAQIANVLGVSGKDTDEKINNTRTAIQSTAKITLNGRSALKGQGQITDKETDLLSAAESGKIDFTVNELKVISGVARRVAKAQYEEHQRNMKVMRSKPELSNVADFYEVGDLPGTTNTPKPTGGQFDAEKERRYQEWKARQAK